MKFFRWLPVAAGVSLLLFLIRSMGATTLWNQIRSIGWIGLWIIFATYTVIFTLDTWGWHFSFPKAMTQTFRWHSLFGSRMAGEAVNYLTPLGALGGEPLKARILRSRYPISWSDSLVSLVVAKTSFVIGLILLILSGLSIAFWHSRLSNQLKWIALGLASAFALLILLFWLLQQWLLSRMGCAIFKSLGKRFPLFSSNQVSIFAGRRFDQKITRFYQNNRPRFFLSIFFHFLGWAFGIVEVYWILRLLHVPITWPQAYILEALWQLVKATSFLIPGSLGVQEGGALLICTGLGLNPASGIALALIRRFRDLVWAGMGLSACAWLTKQPKKGGQSPIFQHV